MYETINHTWYNLTGHIYRSNNRIIRVKIQALCVDEDTGINMKVTFVENKKPKKKLISPITLAAMHIMWLDNIVVSDDEVVTDDEQTYDTPKCLKKLELHKNEMTIKPQLVDFTLIQANMLLMTTKCL